jgi:tetratricopeptide (TPR) repeat protein
MYRWTPDSAERAHRLVDEAMAIVGDVPLLMATKGLLHWNDVNTNRVAADDGLERASERAARALAVEADLPLAVYVRGLAAALGGRPESALPDLYRAHELAPNDANILAEVCRFSNVGGLRQHEALVHRLGEIDPLTALTPLVFSTFYWLRGRRDEIAPWVRRAVTLAPAPSMLHILGAWQLEAAGFREEASAILREAGRALAGTSHGSWATFHERALAGDEAGAMAQLAGAAVPGDVGSIMVAESCALLGRRDDAVRWARTAIEFGFVNYPFLSEHSQPLAVLRADPEFQALLRDGKRRWEGLIAWEQQRGEHRYPR